MEDELFEDELELVGNPILFKVNEVIRLSSSVNPRDIERVLDLGDTLLQSGMLTEEQATKVAEAVDKARKLQQANLSQGKSF